MSDSPIQKDDELQPSIQPDLLEGESGAVLPEPTAPTIRTKSHRAGIGGTFSHSPDCKCNPCAARRRQQETLAIAAGVGGAQLAAPTGNPTKTVLTKAGVRKAAPRDLRSRIAQYLHYSMTLPNATKAEIADKMGITPKRLYEILQEGRSEGILEFSDPLDRIDYELVPKILDNLNHFLDIRDKTVTIEAAKGTLFKTYQESRGLTESSQTVLALKIEMPDGQDVKIVTGHIVGRPKELVSDPDAL